jgi:cell division septal protein FtsQ
MDTKKTKQTAPKSRTTRPAGTAAKGTSSAKIRKDAAQKSNNRTASQRRRPAAQTAKRSIEKTASSRPRKQAAPVQPAPEVVYTPAKPFNRGRFILQLATVVAVVLALSFGISIFFKVEVITVAGAEKYDVWTVKEASGIEIGDNLLSFGEAKAAGKIKTALPYVKSVRIGIKLPDTVNIEIKELDVVYAIKDAVEQWWLITSGGRVVDKADSATAGDYTQIYGVKLASPVAGQQAVAQEEAPPETTDDALTPTLAPVVRAGDRLKAALDILQYLEECSIIGEAASINVADLGNMELQYGQRFLVKLGDTTQLLYKIKLMNAAINGKDENNSLKDYDSGVLDISFTIKENQVIYQASEE